MAANAACDWPSAIRHSRSVRGSTTSHHAIGAGRLEARGWRRAYFSQPISGPDRSLCSLHIRRGTLNVGTIGVFSRKMARQAGFEPATPGLEGRKCCYPELRETRRKFFRLTGHFQGDPGLAARPRLAAAPPRGPPPAHGARSRRCGNTATPRPQLPRTPPRVAPGAGCGPDVWRGGRPETDAHHGIRGRSSPAQRP